ncbi:MAG: Transmembrane exosortase (ExosortaseEpsH) [Bacteroidetes bacterium]|nr:MAG: Transmembrane exosortase (ExosortaseEpsH) [Bacteroidota bacterium]
MAKTDFFKSKVVIFLAFFLGLYLGWYLLYEWVLHPWGRLDQFVINNTATLAEKLLQVFGYDTFSDNNPTVRTIGVDGTHGLWIGDPCNGLTLFALFSTFILAYPGSWKHKAWFIPSGILLIHAANILRVTGLCIIVEVSPEWLNFNHTYTFQILMYVLIFALWMLWVKKFTPGKKEAA